ncbi:MAG TPA: helix-turn-helix transcriptional regulator, partial [Actinomycetota bacterium]|nr:helix-turn-helix transcriptional regulator [Actinomycetota bacterium]
MRGAREARGVSRREFSKRLGWSHSNLADYENGHRVATAEIVQAYETALGLIPGSLVEIWQLASDERHGMMRQRAPRGDSPAPSRLDR